MRRFVLCAAVLLCGLVVDGGGRAQADTCYYVGPDYGSWHVLDNWSCDHLPNNHDTASIFNDLTVRITEDEHISV
jgi:hypothetical protein